MSEPVESHEPDPDLVRPMPIRSTADALWLLRRAHAIPLKQSTLGFLLDDDGIGGKVFEFEHPPHDDLLFVIAGSLAQAGAERGLTSLVLASVRLGTRHGRSFLGDLLPGDVDRWLEASSICEGHGIRLLDWFVIGHGGIQCPRDLLGEPSRWPS
ncbi:MAG: hypothetical protein ACOYMR_14550 [Ilumatobacteraceae bacterium]